MLQAEARAHRIGQTKPVTVYKLCTQGTVEEQMMGRIQKKLYLSAKVTEGMRDIHTASAAETRKKGPRSAADEDMPQLDTSQLVSLVRRGAQALAHPELDINEMLNWDWPTMLEKCKDKPADIHISEQTTGKVNVREEDEKKWLSQMEHVESRVFQGKRYTKEKDVNSYSDIKQEWSREERRKGKNTTVMIDGYAVSKESMLCGDWEAVPTFAGKDQRLAQPKREKKKPLVNQEVSRRLVLRSRKSITFSSTVKFAGMVANLYSAPCALAPIILHVLIRTPKLGLKVRWASAAISINASIVNKKPQMLGA